MRRRSTNLILIATAAVAVVLVFMLWSRSGAETGKSAAPAAGSPRPPPALSVFVHEVRPRPLAETIVANGTLRANEMVELRSEIDGRVVELNFEEGRPVRAGELLLRVNDAELQAQLRQVVARADLAAVQEQRQRQLFETGSTSQETLDESINQTRVLQAEADLIRAQIEKAHIRAPFAGRIGLRFVSVGGYVSPATPIATLTNLEQLKLDFSISERYMNRVRPGTPIRFRVESSPETYQGEVYAVEPAIDTATRTILLRALAANPESRLLPGAYASVEVELDEISDALMVPTTALSPGARERVVFVVEDGKAQPRSVETGVRLNREIQIVSGIAAGDTVITSGLLQLRPGMPVTPLREEKEAASESAERGATPP